MKISIITVSYNAAATIEQTISSVVNQRYKDIEYIIIDGGSTDGTVDIIQKYADKIAYWVSEPDKGIYDAMNKGIKAATGDYIQIIGSDDCLYDSDTISKVAKNIQSDEEHSAGLADIYSYGIYGVDDGKHIEKYAGNAHAKNNPDNHDMIPHGGMFVKRSIYLDNLFDISYKISADYKFFLTCFMNHEIKFKFFDMPVMYFSLAGMSSVNEEKAVKENTRIYDELGISFVGWKFYIKKVMRMCGLFSLVEWRRNKIGWRKHQCSNKICRWCGRL